MVKQKGGRSGDTALFSWWREGDLDGFFGLFVDNLIQLILIAVLCLNVVHMPPEMVFGKIMPAVALSILFGNILYGLQARKLALETGRKDVTALPYGINTVSLFAYIFFVMKPVYDQTQDVNLAWLAGVAACFGSGVIEIAGSWVAGWVKKVTPRAALLATLAGIAITFISMDFSFRIYSNPLVSFAPLAFIFIQYIGKRSLPGKVPAGLVAVISGTVLAWFYGDISRDQLSQAATFSLELPTFHAGIFFSGEFYLYMLQFLSVIVPMGLFNLIGSLQNLESAEAAGDKYPVRDSLLINGAGTILASFFGSVFPTTIYIGHPAWKGMGSGAGYSLANGVVIAFLSFFGLVSFVSVLIPIEAGAAILLWIGITIAAQSFQATPKEHAPAVVTGFIPALAAWGLLMISNALQAAGTSVGQLGLEKLDFFYVRGMIALDRGFIFTSMVFAAMTVAIIEKRFVTGALWAFAASALSLTGIIHGYDIVDGVLVSSYGPETTWPFVSGYFIIGFIFIAIDKLIIAMERGRG